jgi:hypothetical protein
VFSAVSTAFCGGSGHRSRIGEGNENCEGVANRIIKKEPGEQRCFQDFGHEHTMPVVPLKPGIPVSAG